MPFKILKVKKTGEEFTMEYNEEQAGGDIKRFLVFAGDFHEAVGGCKNLKASVETTEDLDKLALDRGYDWINVLDTQTGKYLNLMGSGQSVIMSDLRDYFKGGKQHGPSSETYDGRRIS